MHDSIQISPSDSNKGDIACKPENSPAIVVLELKVWFLS